MLKYQVQAKTRRMQVKALPWFSAVRKKLDDPAYSGFFLKFNSTSGQPHVPRCDNRTSPPKCSIFYHDQLQSPEWNGTVDVHSLNDGNCTAGGCDCGKNPCGEFLYDHRNGSMLRQVRPPHTQNTNKNTKTRLRIATFGMNAIVCPDRLGTNRTHKEALHPMNALCRSVRQWLVDEIIGGPTGIDNPAVAGVNIDDYWAWNGKPGTYSEELRGTLGKIQTGWSPHSQRSFEVSWVSDVYISRSRYRCKRAFRGGYQCS